MKHSLCYNPFKLELFIAGTNFLGQFNSTLATINLLDRAHDYKLWPHHQITINGHHSLKSEPRKGWKKKKTVGITSKRLTFFAISSNIVLFSFSFSHHYTALFFCPPPPSPNVMLFFVRSRRVLNESSIFFFSRFRHVFTPSDEIVMLRKNRGV